MRSRITILILCIASGILTLPNSLFGQLDRSIRPAPGPAPEIRVQVPQPYTLANGLKVFVVENHKIPQVTISLYVDYLPFLEGEYTGASQVLAEMLETGTAEKTKDQLNEEIDSWGADVNFNPRGFRASSLSRHAPNLFHLLTDMFLYPNFQEEELEKIKRRSISSLALSQKNPTAVASQVSNAVAYGSQHPYGELTSERTLKNISLDYIQQLYDTCFHPEISYLMVVGDVQAEEVWEWAEKYLGSWEKGTTLDQEYRSPVAPESPIVILVDMPGAVQSTLTVIQPILLRRGDKDEFGALVANQILGVGFSSRLFQNLREKNGYTYGVQSSMKRNRTASDFSIFSQVKNEATLPAIKEILEEMDRMRNEYVDSLELESAKASLIGEFSRSLENPNTIAGFAITLESNQLDPKYLKHYLKNIGAVTVEDVQQAAKRFMASQNTYLIVVGNADSLRSGLAQFGKVVPYDRTGKPIPQNLREPAPKGMTSESVIRQYISSIGGRDNLAAIKDYSILYKGVIKGKELTLDIKKRAPNLMSNRVEAGLFVQKTIFDGNKGLVTNSVTGRKMLHGGELESLRYGAALFPELSFDDFNYEMRLMGVVKVNGKQAFEIEVTDPGGQISTYYFDRATGLKVQKKTQVTSTEGRPEVQVTHYANYQKIGGVRIPHTLSQQLGQESIEMNAVEVRVNENIKKKEFKIGS